ncbi:MAG TPA: NAD(P)/FAD-dependent oxidoreductase [Thermomicrobiales bacterium]|nr:NAD(P)/FAD-dependent oxidoreductase [Thermomicrobiales bacterium]
MTTTKHIGIVGGGYAGLTAALRLAQRGYKVTLWERAPHFGGQAIAFDVPGNQLEYFYHHLFQSDREIAALINELGIGDKLMWLPSNVGYFADDGKIYPLNGAKDLLKLSIIPFHDRVRLGLVTAYLQRVKKWEKFEKVTAEAWLTKWLGKRAYKKTLGAQLDAKFGKYQHDVAMVWFWGKIWLRTTSRKSPLDQEKLGYIKGSFNVVTDAIVAGARAAGAELISGATLNGLQPNADGTWQVNFDEGDPAQVDAVIVTTPSPIMMRLAPMLPEAYKQKLSGLTYEAAAVALLQLDRKLSDIYWLNIADPEMPFTGVIEHTNFMPPADYDGKHYVYLSKYMEPDHPYFTLPEADLIKEYLPYLKKINPAFDESWITKWWVFRERAAQPIVTMNYREKLPDHRTPLPNLFLANTSQIYPEDRGTNYSVRLGNQIAELVAGDLG